MKEKTERNNIRISVQLSFVLLVVGALISGFWLLQSANSLPQIRGVIVPDGRPIDSFILLDHRDRAFSNQELVGRWHLVAYGYTNCPDVCPNLLNILTQMKSELEAEQPKFDDVQILFYTIDHQRDTVAHLSEYMPFFHPEFLGLTHLDEMRDSAMRFEESLGMKSVLTPLPESERNEFSGDYSVAHGVMLYLINPKGQLQAVFKPKKDLQGVQYFTVDKILRDYLAVRKYFS